jgi:RND superfamily putative drug exporter
MSVSVEGIASFSGRRPWLIVFSWLLVLVAAGFSLTSLLPSALQGGQGPTRTLEYQKAQNLVDERFGSIDGVAQAGESEGTMSELILFVGKTIGPGDAQFDSNVSNFAEDLADAESAAGVQILSTAWSNYPAQPSQDGTSLLVFASILQESETHIGSLLHVAEEARSDDFDVYFIGNASINHTFGELAESDLQTGESIGIAVALIILALVFGSVVAAFIPIILAIVAIFAALGVAGVVGQIYDLNEFVPNIMTMMGLAVGIDYSLFILSRYREERNRGLTKQQAIEASSGSAGRAVVFSGFTVVLALLGMLIIPERTFQVFGLGAIMVVFVAVIVGMTLLPALIGILGDRVWAVRAPVRLTLGLFILGSVVAALTIGIGPQLLAVSALVMIILSVLTVLRKFTGSTRSFGLGEEMAKDTSDGGGFWNAITIRVMNRPWVSMAIATTFLVVLGSFYFQLEKGTGGISALPDDEPAKQGFELLDAKYGFGSNAPALVAIDGDIGSTEFAEAISKLEQAIVDDSGLLMLYPDDDNPNRQPPVRLEPSVGLASLSAVLPGDPSEQTALNTVRRLRNELIPNAFSDIPRESYSIYVGGSSAEVVDSVKITDQYLPIVFATVLSLSFILLLFAFRSITISFASIIMNLLSVGASYGLVVLVFQKGFLIDLFGFKQVDQVEFWLPLFMFSILFGLSMDYHVFMLSRIKEHYDVTGLATESVAFGLRTTASIITGAALIMVAVFGGFALGDITFFQSMGFGLGAAVLLDATVVRSVLVPSVMQILGRHAWYLPTWLEWIPNISIEGKLDSTTVSSD